MRLRSRPPKLISPRIRHLDFEPDGNGNLRLPRKDSQHVLRRHRAGLEQGSIPGCGPLSGRRGGPRDDGGRHHGDGDAVVPDLCKTPGHHGEGGTSPGGAVTGSKRKDETQER